MQRTLFIPGSLASEGGRKIISAAKPGSLEVLEVETYIPTENRPPGILWVNALDYHGFEEQNRIDEHTNDLLDAFLEPDGTEPEDIPLSRSFRAACLGMLCRKWINPYLVNLDLARRFLTTRPAFDQIIVAPGGGISFRAWKQIANQYGLPVHFLTPEKRPFSLSRKWQRLVQRLRNRRPVVASTPVSSEVGAVDVWCASQRVARLLVGDNNFSWRHGSGADLGAPSEEEITALKARYESWWKDCEQRWLQLFKDQPSDPRSILIDLGRQQSREVYPIFAWKFLRARMRLELNRPKMLIVDTQEGSHDLAWALAAQQLGIPVAAYTYDHMLQPKFSLRPDWVLSDSARHDHVAKARGLHEDRIIRVASSRRPPEIRKKDVFAGRPQILFADSYYSGTSATVEPQCSQRQYQAIIAAAREMPDCLFQIKFHPLRDRKRESQCFIGMDEDELYLRTRFIQSLKPPSNVQTIAPEQNMLRYLERADVVLNSNSTAGLEAFALGIPVIFLHAPHLELAFPMIHDYGACQLAVNPGSLQKELRRLLQDPDHALGLVERQRRYVNECYWRSDSQTLAQGIQQILASL